MLVRGCTKGSDFVGRSHELREVLMCIWRKQNPVEFVFLVPDGTVLLWGPPLSFGAGWQVLAKPGLAAEGVLCFDFCMCQRKQNWEVS